MLALARKYRPRVLKDLIGQEVFVDVISNAIRMNRIHHAFLLTGTRGIGKTTSARILALSLNCIGENSNSKETTNPCLKCNICTSILSGSNPDIIEFDAASNTGVDSMREIIEQSNFAPIMSRYKIYIIDEVHMLSKSAFNALLKTLEEPPARVKFIFATTEIKKIPITILSRCQKFYLAEIAQNQIATYLEKVCNSENITSYDKSGINLIAKHANGSMRDGLSLLDQAINISNGKLDMESIKKMLGVTENSKIAQIFYLLYLGYIQETLKIVDDLMHNNTTVNNFIAELLQQCCYAMRFIDKIDTSSIPSETAEQLQTLQETGSLNMPRVLRMWQTITASLHEMSNIDNQLYITSIIFRISYINTLPTPVEMLKLINNPNLQHAMTKFPNGKIIK